MVFAVALLMGKGEQDLSTENRKMKKWEQTGLPIFRGKKKQNFAGFSGANSRKNRPISRDFRGKKSQKSQKNRPISRDFSGKKSNFEGFQGQILRKIG